MYATEGNEEMQKLMADLFLFLAFKISYLWALTKAEQYVENVSLSQL